MPKWKSVNREQFEEFLASYPRSLERDVAFTHEPPVLNYNDFTLGNWPESMVATYTHGWMTPPTWHIREDITVVPTQEAQKA